MGNGRGVRTTLAGQWGKFVVQSFGFVALSRFLSVQDFGLIALAAVGMAIAAILGDMGLYLAAIRDEALSQSQLSFLLFANAISGILAGLLVALLGFGLSWFYSEPRLVEICLALGGSLVVTAVGVQWRADLTRKGRFGILAIQDVAAATVAVAVAVSLAARGAGYWSLVGLTLTQALVLTLLALIQSSWLPGRPCSFQEARSLLRFGADTAGLSLLNLSSRSVDVLAIGRFQGQVELGLYGRSSQLISLVFQQAVSPLTRVALPRLSGKPNALELQKTTERLLKAIVYVLYGGLILLSALSTVAIPVILGSEWRAAGPIVGVMALGGAFAALGYVAYWVLLSMGHSGALLRAELPGRCIMILGSIPAATVGPLLVAGVIVVGQFINLVFAGRALSKRSVAIRGLAQASAVPLFVMSFAGLGAAILSRIPPTGMWGLVLGAAFWLMLLVLVVIFSPRVRLDLREVLELGRS